MAIERRRSDVDLGTDRYRAGEDTPPGLGTDGFQASKEIPSEPDTDRYRSAGDASPARGDEHQPAEEEPFWRRLGFNSFEEYLDHLEEHQERTLGSYKAPVRCTAATGAYRQVGVKLAPDDYDSLAALARSNGLSPTTMARLLVVRGVRSRR